MLTNVLFGVAGVSPFLLLMLAGCAAGAGLDHLPNQLHHPEEAQESRQEETLPLPALVKIEEIADRIGILGGHGSSYTYIDGGLQDGFMIVHETFASRTKYKAITPIIRVEEKRLIIDCSYVRSLDEADGVAVGKYCRGPTAASAEALEGAIGDEHMLLYSVSAPWISLAEVEDCKNPMGLKYVNLYSVRCDSASEDETTSSVSIMLFSSELELIFSMPGYEFAPDVRESNPRVLTFWRLGEDSHHRVVDRPLP